jgi:hypothetical protein
MLRYCYNHSFYSFYVDDLRTIAEPQLEAEWTS